MPTQLPPSLQRLLGGPGGPDELEAGFKGSKIVTYIGIMEKKNGNYYSILGLYRDNGTMGLQISSSWGANWNFRFSSGGSKVGSM